MHFFLRDKTTKSIKFHTSVPQPESYGMLKVCKTEFKLGLGPCGRHVTELHHRIDGDLMTITQWSRDPNYLVPPNSDAVVKADLKIKRDQDLRRAHERQIGSFVTYTLRHRVLKGYRWGFWPIYEWVDLPAPKEVTIKGALSEEEITELNKTISDFEKATKVWMADLEKKQFVYKLTDIHGRIEVVNS